MKKNANNIIKVEHASAVRREPSRMGRGPSKTFQENGHWIEKKNKTAILVCECGNKYIKTRAAQARCLRCLAYLTTSAHR